MKKGFSLAELMGVVVLLALIALMVVPVVDKQIKNSRNELYESQVESIKSSAKLYADKLSIKDNEVVVITLYQLKQLGLVDKDIINPKDKKLIPNDSTVTIQKINGIISYEFTIGTNTRGYDSIPKISLNGDIVEYVELNDSYTELGSSSNYNDEVLEVTIEQNIDTNTVGSYIVKYKSSYEDVSNEAIRNVIVRDTKGPIVEFNELTLLLSEVDSYDFKSDIIANDPSGIKDIDVQTNFGALKGEYSIKYTVIDNYDNKTIKYRKVVVK